MAEKWFENIRPETNRLTIRETEENETIRQLQKGLFDLLNRLIIVFRDISENNNVVNKKRSGEKDQKINQDKQITRRRLLKLLALLGVGEFFEHKTMKRGIENPLWQWLLEKQDLENKWTILRDSKKVKVQDAKVTSGKKQDAENNNIPRIKNSKETDAIINGRISSIEQGGLNGLKAMLIQQYLHKGKIEINSAIQKRLELYWTRSYQKGGMLHQGLIDTLDRMRKWYKELKKIFIINRLPEDLMYLSIVESNFIAKAKSGSGAYGQWQLTKQAVEDVRGGLRMDNKFDERADVLKGSLVAVRFLRKLHQEISSFNRQVGYDLAIASYNGRSYFTKYKHQHQGSLQGLRTYQDYLNFRSEELTKYLNQVFQQGYFNYKVQKRDTVSRLSRQFKINEKDLLADNPIINVKTKKINRGCVLKIKIQNTDPQEKQRALELLFTTDLHSALESLNYYAKWVGCKQALKRDDLKLQDRFDATEIIKLPYLSRQGMNLKQIIHRYGSKYKMTEDDFKELNGHINSLTIAIPANINVYVIKNRQDFFKWLSVKNNKRKTRV